MSGRILSTFAGDDAAFVDSDYVFTLGDHRLVGRYPLNTGDGVRVEQEHDFQPVGPLGVPHIVRFGARMRNPAYTPAGYGWRFSLWLDGVMAMSRLMRLPDRNLVDMAFVVAGSAGLHTLRFQLELVLL